MTEKAANKRKALPVALHQILRVSLSKLKLLTSLFNPEKPPKVLSARPMAFSDP